MKVAAEIETVLEVTELPDLPTYSTAGAERMSGAGPVDGHRAVYRSPRWTSGGLEVPASERIQSRMAGKSTISRIERLPVIRRTSRSMPSPMPPVGGIPCSSAWTNASS
jgi:hypothetical protein